MCIDTEYTIDIISNLPLELIDELVKHLDGTDILTCSRVSRQWKRRMDQEHVWRTLCNERRWILSKVNDDIKCWRNLYWLNQNWSKGFYTFYKFSDEDILFPESFLVPSFNTAYTDFTSLDSDGEFLILPRRDGINIWDIKSDVKIHQRITNKLNKYCSLFDIKVNKQFIIYLTGNYIQIYKKDSNSKMYEQIKILHLEEGIAKEVIRNENLSEIYEFEMNHKAEVSENYLVIVQGDKNLFVWFLKPWEFIASVDVAERGIKITEIKIMSNHVFLLQIRGNEFRIRSFDVLNKSWTLDLHPHGSDSILDDVHPRLIVNHKLIACLFPCNMNNTVLKVWDFQGKLLTITTLPTETYTQCCVVNDIVIYKSAKNTITIWSSETDSIIKELSINGSFNFIEVCPGDLLLVAKLDAFEVWDWKKGKQLYTIKEKTHLCYTRLLNSFFYAILVMDMDRETSHVVPQIIVFYFGTNIVRA